MEKKYGIVAWFLATLFVVYSFCLNTAAGVFAAPIKEALNLTPQQATMAVSSFTIGFAAMQIPAGVLLDRFNNRLVICAAILTLAVGCFLTSLSSNLVCFIVANVIMGIGGAFAFIAAGKTVSSWFSLILFPIMFGLTQTMSCLLSGIIHAVLTNALNVMSWKAIYLILSLAGTGLFILTSLFFRNPGEAKTEKAPPSPSPSTMSLSAALWKVAVNPQVWICSVVAALSFGGILAYAEVWYAGIQEHYHVDKDGVTFMGTLIFAGIGIGTPLWGFVANAVNSKKQVMHFTLALGALFLLLAIYLPHFPVKTLIISRTLAFGVGFFLSGSMLTYAIAAEVVSAELTGMALGVVNTCVFLANTLFLSFPYALKTEDAKFYNTDVLFPLAVVTALGLLVFVKEVVTKPKKTREMEELERLLDKGRQEILETARKIAE